MGTLKQEKGVALIVMAAFLSILAAMATGFYTLMLMQTKSAIHYGDSVRAELLARGGISFSIVQLQAQAFKKIEDPTAPWFMYDYLNGAKRSLSYPDSPLLHNGVDDDNDGQIDNWEEARVQPDLIRGYSVAVTNSGNDDLSTEGASDRFSLNISDAASRINVNAGDNLAVVLDNLCRAIGPPLVPADQTALVQRVWEWYGGGKYNTDANDWPKGSTPGLPPFTAVPRNIYYWLYGANGALTWDGVNASLSGAGRPKLRNDGSGAALYGDGYAIAGWRAKNGKFETLDQVKQALTYRERNGNGTPDDPLEQLEIEVKFQALRDYITIDSWVDTHTVCVGKFEWVFQSGPSPTDPYDIAIDRDKSWICDDLANDPMNTRGSLRGCYVAILNGHGAGQLRRIRTNGVDWIQLDIFKDKNNNWTGFTVPPGPISSYMLIPPENAKLVDVNGKDLAFTYPDNPPPLGKLTFPKTDARGDFVPAEYGDGSPKIDYGTRPLCFHRAPVNVNTASDKVLTALFLGINVTQGSYLAVGTDADITQLAPMKSRYQWKPTDPDWKIKDYDDPNQVYRIVEPYILTPKGLKRIPAGPGYLTLGRNTPWPAADAGKFNYIVNSGNLGPPYFTIGSDAKNRKYTTNAAQELAYRIIVARQSDPANPDLKWIDPKTGWPTKVQNPAYLRGPFHSWDELYFRVVRPWDEQRLDPKSPGYDPKAGSVARLIMAHFNPNTDLLKFNPNIEWIDRWGRNFTELEPVMVYTNSPEYADGQSLLGHGPIDGTRLLPGGDLYFQPGLFMTCDQDARGLTNQALPVFSRERLWDMGLPNQMPPPYTQSLFVSGVFGTDPKWQGSYAVRSFRYKADELIDKSDLNRSTTELCFDSHGIYEIQSTGQVLKRGAVLAERKVQALVKVYDVWSESTQREFVQGYISRATGAPGTPQAGQVTRDCCNVLDRLALVTLPEPLVPLGYRINNPKSKELVDLSLGDVGKKRNAWGTPVDMNIPLIVANNVQPAGYDGQLVLATNTQRFEPSNYTTDPQGDCDTFLASFNGDLDTETAIGNGHEQAKSPFDSTVQVENAMGLLGALNDTVIASDPGLKGPQQSGQLGNFAQPDLASPPNSPNYAPITPCGTNPAAPLEIFRFQTLRCALRGLRPDFYWNNVTCRQGDLRADGLYVGGPGMAGNRGVIKYESGSDTSVGPGQTVPADVYNSQNLSLNGRGAQRAVGENYGGSGGAVQGLLLSLWAKTAWHHNDNRGHEFLQSSTPAWLYSGIGAAAFWFRKHGGPQFAAMETGSLPYNLMPWEDAQAWEGQAANGNRINDFAFGGEWQMGSSDYNGSCGIWGAYLHGGYTGVVPQRLDPTRYPLSYLPESPSYYTQPFRWHFMGFRLWLKTSFAQCTNGGASSLSDPSGMIGSVSGYLKFNGSPDGWSDSNTGWTTQNIQRPFIDSERWSDSGGPNTYDWKGKYWSIYTPMGNQGFCVYQQKNSAGPLSPNGSAGNPVRYSWAAPGGNKTLDGAYIYDHPVFGLNLCNHGKGYFDSGPGVPSYTGQQGATATCSFSGFYRGSIEEGTHAVIDEYKISRKETVLANPPDWQNDRITRTDPARPGEMTLSRYYLPVDPNMRQQCPTFTSQTMLQSLKGYDKKTAAVPENVKLARVSWNCFTPRFMHEYKGWDSAKPKFQRCETVTKGLGIEGWNPHQPPPGGQPTTKVWVPFRGPFNYWVYNDLAVSNDVASRIDNRTLRADEYEDYNDPAYDADFKVVPYRCNRPTPADYQTVRPYKDDLDYHATKGVEIEILQCQDEDPSAQTAKTLGANSPFVNPAVLNPILDPNGQPITVRTDRLRYRVRFRYPVDKLADPTSLAAGVDPQSQFLLDTPVFDDISITYFGKPVILDYKEVLE